MLGSEGIDRRRRKPESVKKPKHPDTGSLPSHRPIRQVCAPKCSVALTYSAVRKGLVGSLAAICSISGPGGASIERNCRLTFFLVNRCFQSPGVDQEFAHSPGARRLDVLPKPRSSWSPLLACSDGHRDESHAASTWLNLRNSFHSRPTSKRSRTGTL